MKRSRIFLGVTTGCLAIAGVVAAKASHFGHDSGFLYTSASLSTGCKGIESATVCLKQVNGMFVCKTTAAHVRPYYTLRTFINPANPSQGTKCLHPLTYNDL